MLLISRHRHFLRHHISCIVISTNIICWRSNIHHNRLLRHRKLGFGISRGRMMHLLLNLWISKFFFSVSNSHVWLTLYANFRFFMFYICSFPGMLINRSWVNVKGHILILTKTRSNRPTTNWLISDGCPNHRMWVMSELIPKTSSKVESMSICCKDWSEVRPHCSNSSYLQIFWCCILFCYIEISL